jgi:hypothetical protein
MFSALETALGRNRGLLQVGMTVLISGIGIDHPSLFIRVIQS